jgi:hypothetical protein
MSEGIPDGTPVGMDEVRQVLTKFDGDFTAEQIANGEAGEPVETIIIENGVVVEHIINDPEGGNN